MSEHYCTDCGDVLSSTAQYSLVPRTGKHYCFGCEPKGVVVTTFTPPDYEPADSPGWEGGFADNH